jgi:large subunit ribosomal protein L24
MKNKFSKNWKASKSPRKQRKYIMEAPISTKKKFLGVNLSKELRKKYGKRNIPARKDDIVKILRGKFKKKKGKILNVRTKMSRIEIEGIQVKKQDGSKVNVKLHPSNLQIVELTLEDRKRSKGLKVKKEDIKTPKEVSKKE